MDIVDQREKQNSINNSMLKFAYNPKKDIRLMIACLILLAVTIIIPAVGLPVLSHIHHKEAVAISTSTIRDGQIILSLTGEDIAYENCLEYTMLYGTEYAVDYDENSRTICFTYHNTDTNIYIRTVSGKTIHFLLTTK